MKCASLVPESLLPRAQTTKVFRRLWHHIRPQLHDDPTQLGSVRRHIKVHLMTEKSSLLTMNMCRARVEILCAAGLTILKSFLVN